MPKTFDSVSFQKEIEDFEIEYEIDYDLTEEIQPLRSVLGQQRRQAEYVRDY